jgi:hypothetical protein
MLNLRPNVRIPRRDTCPRCLRPAGQCLCGRLKTIDTRLRVLILQHPQEQRKLLNSARLTSMVLTNSTLRVGLSWPNLGRALGEEADPKHWGVLYPLKEPAGEELLRFTDRKGRVVTALEGLEGIVVLDASWRQSRTLWWRNPWLTRLSRICLNPAHRSIRYQTKATGLTTAEAVGLTLEALEPDRGTEEAVVGQFVTLIAEPNRRTASTRASGASRHTGHRRRRPGRKKRLPHGEDAS